MATEVRTLAARSSEAARQVKSLVGESVQRVEAGSRLADEAGTTMGEAVSEVRRVAELIGAISAATAQQTSGIA